MSAVKRCVGTSIERFEDEALLTGHARFMDDLEPVAGPCHAAILRSPHGCADIISINVKAAEVLAGLTSDDETAMSKPIGNMTSAKLQYFPCAVKRVRYFGEPAVVPENRYLAEDALDLIAVEYAPKPTVVGAEDALVTGVTVLHEEFGSNVVQKRTFRYGDTEKHFGARKRRAERSARVVSQSSRPIMQVPHARDTGVGQQFLNEKAEPTEHEVRDNLSGHLCRCTGYALIVDAIVATAQSRKKT